MQGKNTDNINGYIRVQIEPSIKIHQGINFNVNHHYQVKNTDEVLGSEEMIEILENYWYPSLERAKKIVYHLLESK